MSHSLALTFNGVALSPISYKNQTWLTSVELAKALGYAESDSVTRIYNRNKEEFTPNMTMLRDGQIDPLGESSGLQREVRVFSLRGCHLIAMFSRTAIAKQFRKWVLDILDKEVGEPKPYGLKNKATIAQPKKTVLTLKTRNCWLRLVEIYGNQLLNEYGEKMPDVWVEAVEELTDAQIACGFEGIKKSRSPFMPRLPVFLAYCHEKDVVTAKHKEMELVEKKNVLEGKLLAPMERTTQLDEPEKQVMTALSQVESVKARKNFASFIGFMAEDKEGLAEFLDILSHATPKV